MSTQMYEIIAIPSAGLGLVAKSRIPRGTLILSEPPLFTSKSLTLYHGLAVTELASVVRALSPADKLSFYYLYNQYKTSEASQEVGIFRTNSAAMNPQSTEWGIFPICSRINHSCAPNSHATWNATLGKRVLYALRDILPGEQITRSYLVGQVFGLDHRNRRRVISQTFQFSCSCTWCCRSPAEITASDKRREEIAELKNAVAGPQPVLLDPHKALGQCRRLLELYKEEQLNDDSAVNTYNTALQICATYGDMARTSAFASLVADAMVIAHGPGSVPDKVQMAIDQPEKHELSGLMGMFGMTWQQNNISVPRRGSAEFERWLWARASR